MLTAFVDELQDKLRRLTERVGALEAGEGRRTATKRGLVAVAFADLPASAALGEAYIVTDKTAPGGAEASCLAIWNGAVWVGPDGNDVAGY